MDKMIFKQIHKPLITMTKRAVGVINVTIH